MDTERAAERPLLARAIAKFLREVRGPSDAATFIARLVVPKDPRARALRSWVWGKLPRVDLQAVFAGIANVNVTLLNAFHREAETSLDIEEVAVLAAVAKFKNVRNLIEVGTFDGNTTLNLAANTPDDAVITTIDLPTDWKGEMKIRIPDAYGNVTRRDRVGVQFRGTPYERKIRQVFADSAELDWAALSPGGFDFVLIDGCHFRDYVKKDTQNALRNISPGGIVVWHDYGNSKHVTDVVEAVAKGRRVYAIAGTRLAIATGD